jgi:hypothetical protein
VEIANKGWKKAMQENDEIKLGANVIDGKVTYKAVAEAFDGQTIPKDRLGTNGMPHSGSLHAIQFHVHPGSSC